MSIPPFVSFSISGMTDDITVLLPTLFLALSIRPGGMGDIANRRSDPDLLSDDFVYVEPLVGPLDKAGYLELFATGEFGGLGDGVPDLDYGAQVSGASKPGREARMNNPGRGRFVTPTFVRSFHYYSFRLPFLTPLPPFCHCEPRCCDRIGSSPRERLMWTMTNDNGGALHNTPLPKKCRTFASIRTIHIASGWTLGERKQSPESILGRGASHLIVILSFVSKK